VFHVEPKYRKIRKITKNKNKYSSKDIVQVIAVESFCGEKKSKVGQVCETGRFLSRE